MWRWLRWSWRYLGVMKEIVDLDGLAGKRDVWGLLAGWKERRKERRDGEEGGRMGICL
jgi:hypothetical protein